MHFFSLNSFKNAHATLFWHNGNYHPMKMRIILMDVIYIHNFYATQCRISTSRYGRIYVHKKSIGICVCECICVPKHICVRTFALCICKHTLRLLVIGLYDWSIIKKNTVVKEKIKVFSYLYAKQQITRKARFCDWNLYFLTVQYVQDVLVPGTPLCTGTRYSSEKYLSMYYSSCVAACTRYDWIIDCDITTTV